MENKMANSMKTVKVNDEFFQKSKLSGKTFNQYHGELEQANQDGKLKIAEKELEKIREMQGVIYSLTEQRKADRNLVDSLFKTVKLQDQRITALTDSVEKLTNALTTAIARR